MIVTAKHIAFASVAALAALAVLEAATAKYYQKETDIRAEAKAEMEKLGLTREAAKAKYPTPEIQMASAGCLVPGGAGEVVIRGKFVPGTKFVLESDAIEVVKEALTGSEYRATVKVSPAYPPHTAMVKAISPVSGITGYLSPGIIISGRMEWTMEASNGWKVIARSPADKKCGESGGDPYEVQFFRKGETAPFETRSAKGDFSASNSTEYFNVAGEDVTGGGAQSLESLIKRMSDPKLTDAEREKVMAEMEKLQKTMMESMKNVTALAQQAEAKKKAFGCERMEVKLDGANLAGTMRCSEAVGTRIQLTGTVKTLGR